MSDSTFSGGSSNPAGTFAWVYPDTVISTTGTFSHSVIFTPYDSTNYDTDTHNVSITAEDDE